MSNDSLAPKPCIPASAKMPELTVRALVVGAVLGMIFGASSLYLVLKVGLTVSASIAFGLGVTMPAIMVRVCCWRPAILPAARLPG
jgi:hypothetical protein